MIVSLLSCIPRCVFQEAIPGSDLAPETSVAGDDEHGRACWRASKFYIEGLVPELTRLSSGSYPFHDDFVANPSDLFRQSVVVMT